MSSLRQNIQLIVGLGNPGPDYEETRHNAGAWFIEALCQAFGLSLKVVSKFATRHTRWTFAEKDYHLLVPTTFMNHSGQAVGAFAKYYQIPPEAILIAHDELDFAPGQCQFKTGGGHAGHNGLRDVIHHLNSREFYRIRLGIGHPGNKDEVSDYVLTKPPKEERQLIKTAIETGIIDLQKWLNKDK